MKLHWKTLLAAVLLLFLGAFAAGKIQSAQTKSRVITDHAAAFSSSQDAGETILTGPSHCLARGSYTVTIRCAAGSDSAEAEIYAPDALSEDGSAGRVLGSAALTGEESSFHITCDTNNRYCTVRIRGVESPAAIDSVTITPNRAFTDAWWAYGIAVFCVVLWIYLVFVRYRNKTESRRTILALSALILISCIPVMTGRVYQTSDLYFHLSRIDGIAQALHDGTFPMYLNTVQLYGAGYATPIMYPQLFLYLPAIGMCLGMSLLFAYQLFLVLIHAATVLLAYFSFRALLGKRSSAIIAAAVYSLCIYRYMCLYVRGAAAEVLAMTFFPPVLLAFYRLYAGDLSDRKAVRKEILLLSLSMTGLLESHLLSTLLAAFCAVLFGILCIPKIFSDHPLRRIAAGFASAVLAGCLNLFFLMPFFSYRHEEFVLYSDTDPDHFRALGTYLHQLFAILTPAKTETIFRSDGSTEGESAQSVGLVILIAIIAFLVLAIRQHALRNRTREEKRILALGWFMLSGTLLFLLFSMEIFPWNLAAGIPVLKLFLSVQYPCRFLAFAGLFGSALAGCDLCLVSMHAVNISPQRRNLLWSLILAFACLCSLPYLFSTWELDSITEADYLADAQSDPLYLYREDAGAYSDYEKQELVSDVPDTIFSGCRLEGTDLVFSYTLPEGTDQASITLPLYHYPGYRAEDENGTEVEVGTGSFHKIRITVSGSSGTIHVFFRPYGKWTAGYLVSMVSAAVLVLLWIRSLLKKRSHT